MSKKDSIKSYAIGFVLSMALTLTAYFTVVYKILNGGILIFAIIGLAFIQLVVQLIFFLHLADEKNPRWNLAVFLSTISIVLILVLGSLWIMGNLNYNMMPSDMEMYILHDEGIKR